MTDQPLATSHTRHIPAPPRVVYDLISDVTQMPRYSPETVATRWLDDGPRVGARFSGTNVVGRMRWTTKPVVTAADPGRRFAFRVPSGAISTWTYELTEADGGTVVTESVRTERAVPALIGWLMRRAGVRDRAAHLHDGMVHTLDRLALAAVATTPAHL